MCIYVRETHRVLRRRGGVVLDRLEHAGKLERLIICTLARLTTCAFCTLAPRERLLQHHDHLLRPLLLRIKCSGFGKMAQLWKISSLHPQPSTPHPSPYTVHLTPFTLHPTPQRV